MPQVIVDTAAESSQSLKLLAQLFTDYSILRMHEENTARSGDTRGATAGAETPAWIRAAPLADGYALSEAPLGDGPLEPDPAAIFGKSNVLDFRQPQQTPDVSPAAQSSATPTPASAPSAVSTTGTASVPAALEFDSAGVPWDARIHQVTKGKKKTEGTWKLKKGLDASIAAAVLAEISPKPGAVAPVVPPVTVPASGPVSAALVPPVPGVPVPPGPSILSGGLPGAVPSVPVPGSAAAGAVPPNPIQQFHAMMKKISEALAAQTITNAQVQAAHAGQGLPQLQLAITKPATIPAILQALGL